MKLSVKSGVAEKELADVIIINLFENVKKVPPELNAINKASGSALYQTYWKIVTLPEN